MAELDKKLKITARFAQCFRDYRDSSYVDYSVHQLLAQRVYGIVLGYEDINDHDKLRYDPALPAFLTKSAIAKLRSFTRSMFDPGVNSCSQTTVCCESSRLHQNQLDWQQKAICLA